MLRVLLISEAEKKAAHNLFLFAAKPENIYKPGPGAKVPGGDPRYILQLNDYRCVSVPAKNKLPHPAAVEEIAHLFNIKGSVDDWAQAGHIARNEAEHCIVVVQKL